MHSPEQPSSNDFEFQRNQNEGFKHDDETNEFRSRKKSDLQHEKVPSEKGNFHRTKQVTFSNYGTQRNYKRSADEAFATTEDTHRRSKWNVKEASSQHKQNTEYSERDTDRKRRRVEHISQKQGFARSLHSNVSRGRASIRNEYTQHYRRGRSQNVSPLARILPKDGRSRGNYRARQTSRSPWRQRGNHSVHHLRRGRQRQRSPNEYLKTLQDYSKKESCEIVMIFSTDKHLFEDSIELAKKNTAITFALLCLLDKAFANDLIPANLLNLILTIENSGLITNSVNQLENALTNKSVECTGKEEDNFLHAVSCILRIMIRICKLKPSCYTFVEGSNSFIESLKKTILESQKPIQNKDTNNELDMPEAASEITHVESNDATTSSSKDYFDMCAEKNKYDKYESIERLFNEFSDHRSANLSRRDRIVKSGDQADNLEITEDKLTSFRKMSVIPTIEDLHGETDAMLRPIKAKGEYLNIDDYLDVQFRLLREDFVKPLRDGIRAFIGTNTRKTKKKIQEIKIYENVQLESEFYGDGLNHVLSFDISKLRHIRWNMTKRLKYGSLVVLSPDSFQTCYFAVIMNGDAKNLRKGRLHVRFAIDPELTNALFGVTYVMIETTAYFEAYRPVLKCLQETVDEDLPLGKYIIKCKNTVSPPQYLSKQIMAVDFDLRCLVDSDSKVKAKTYFKIPGLIVPKEQNNYSEDLKHFKHVDIFDKTWTIEDKLSLDQSQLSALKSALTREFSIIQGPPGCGKTFVGLQIAKVLLHNRSKWCSDIFSRSQLLVVCYTNHALDQFIEGIQTFFKGDILRVGSRSSNKNVMDCSISAIRKKFRKAKAFPEIIYKGRRSASDKLEEIKSYMNRIAEKIKILKQNIVREDFLFDEMGSFRDQFMWFPRKQKPPWLKFLGDSLIVEWLQIDEMATKIQNDVFFNKTALRVLSDNDIDDTIILEEREKINNTDEEDQTEINEEDFEDKLAKFKSNYLALDLEAIQTCNDVTIPQHKLKTVKLERQLLVEEINHCLLKASTAQVPKVHSENTSIHRIPLETRWALYWHWVIRICEKDKENIDLDSFKQASERQKETLLMEDKFLFRKAHVIGMTITGAAKYKALLREVKPTIMIVEEAAEVLESHLVSNLTSGCQQLILIGDHKQLKPKPNVYKLETEYNMAISLFERMIRNGLPCDCLQVQHRMRSDIADNIRHIYGTLYDHECVKSYENIQGMKHNAFFINHSDDEHNDSELKSYTNRYEIDFLMALCSYLLLQGYLPSKITILTTYKGQLFLLKKVLMSDFVNLKDVRISTVDNYQGEENDIILLSLVRSNPEGRIGYLARENRICVALSRAKKGLYVIGNFEKLFETSDLWQKIILEMRNKNLCGDILTLMCQNHPNDEGIEIRSPQDFQKAPEGGCGKMCDIRLDCGHTCGKICHTLNKQHNNIVCHKPCLKSCFYGHACQRQCFQECSCDIEISVLLQRCGHVLTMKCKRFEKFDETTYMCSEVCNISLPCGHTCNRKCGDPCICMIPVKKRLQHCNHETEIPCSVNPKKFKCNKQCEKVLPCGHCCLRKCGEKCEPCKTAVERELSDCGHKVNTYCGEDFVNNTCKKTCKRKMDCGHPCPQKCKDDKSYNFQNNIIGSRCAAGHVTNCFVDCKKRLKCGHLCQGNCTLCYQGRWHNKCTEPCDCSLVCGHTCNGTCELCKPCEMPCQRRCSHAICPRPCGVFCITCPYPCAWQCEHYKCTKRCGESCNRERCNKACRKLLSCNHNCIGMCGDPCPLLCRKCDSQDVKKLIFGKEDEKETRFVQLQDCGHIIRYDIMDEYMDLDEGFSIKRCPICREPIRTSKGNRYEKVLNEFYIRLTTLKTHMLNASDSVRHIYENDWRKNNKEKRLSSYFGFLSTYFGFDLLKEINILNQSAVIVFIKNMIRQNDWPEHKADLFPPHDVVMATAQHAHEIENEVRRYLDKCLLEKLHDNFVLSSVYDARNLSKTREWNNFQEAFSILDKKTAYGDNERFKLQKCIDKLSNVKGTKNLIRISIKSGSEDNMISFNSDMDKYKGIYCRCGSVKTICNCQSESSANTKILERFSREKNRSMWYAIRKTQNITIPYKENEIKDHATHKTRLVNNDVKSHFSADFGDSNDSRYANLETNCDTTTTEPEDEMNETFREENIEYVINMVTWGRKPYYECEESKFHCEKIRTPSNKRSKTDFNSKEVSSGKGFSPMQSRKRQMDIPADYEREKKKSKLVKHSSQMGKEKDSKDSNMQNRKKLSNKQNSDAIKISEQKSKSDQQHFKKGTNIRLTKYHQTKSTSGSIKNLSWKNDTATSDSVKTNASKSLKESREIVKYEDLCDFEDPFDKEQSRCHMYSTCKSNIKQMVEKERKQGITKTRSSTHTMDDEPVPKRAREESSKSAKYCNRKKTGEELTNEKVRPKLSSLGSLTKADKTNVLNKSLYYKERNMDIDISNNQNNGKQHYSVVSEKQSDGLCKTSEDFDGSLQNKEGVSGLTNSVKHTTTVKSNDLRNVINTIHKRKEHNKQIGETATSTKSRKVVNRTEKTRFSNHYKGRAERKKRPKCTSNETVLKVENNRVKQDISAENDKLCENDDTWFVIDEV